MNDLVNAKDAKLAAKSKTFVLPNFEDEIEMLQWAGISFGTEDSYRLSKSIKVGRSLHLIFIRGSQ